MVPMFRIMVINSNQPLGLAVTRNLLRIPQVKELMIVDHNTERAASIELQAKLMALITNHSVPITTSSIDVKETSKFSDFLQDAQPDVIINTVSTMTGSYYQTILEALRSKLYVSGSLS